MKNKLLICATIFTILILFFCHYSFANTNQNNSVNLGNTISESLNKAGESTHNVVNAVTNGASNAASGIRDGANNAAGAIKDGTNNAASTVRNGINNGVNTIDGTSGNFNNNARTDNYTATRTSGNSEFAGMTSTSWIWLIMAILAVVIIGLVWYYTVQNTNDRNR